MLIVWVNFNGVIWCNWSELLFFFFFLKLKLIQLTFVLISAQNVGVIVRLERENFHVLGMHGKVIECKPTALHKRRENRNTIALDADQNQIRRRDIVKVMEGPHAVRHIFS